MSRRTDTITPFTRPIEATGEQLNAYGHRMTWAESGHQADGFCQRCLGRVVLHFAAGGRVVASADPFMISPGDGDGLDYAECRGR